MHLIIASVNAWSRVSFLIIVLDSLLGDFESIPPTEVVRTTPWSRDTVSDAFFQHSRTIVLCFVMDDIINKDGSTLLRNLCWSTEALLD